MHTAQRIRTYGVAAGLVAGALDVALILAVDSTAIWDSVEAFLFWLVAGWVVVCSDSGLGHRLHGVVVSVLLNLPWYIALGPAVKQVAHVPPLIVMSVLFGLGFGWARRRACSPSGSSGIADPHSIART